MNRFIVSLFCLAAMCAASQAHAFRFTPFRAQFEPSGAASNRSFTVENNTDQPATVQVSILSRAIDTDGVETTADAAGDFTVYPAQIVLKPHAQRSVRVQWTGDAALKQEKAYRIIAEQLPVNLDKNPPKGGVVRFLVNYAGVIFVTPPGLKQDVVLESFQPVQRDGHRKLELVFHNRGDRHAMLDKLKLDFKNGMTLSGEDKLKDVTGETILAGQKRRMLLDWPADLKAAPSAIDFTYDKQTF